MRGKAGAVEIRSGVEKQEHLRYANTQVSTMGLASGM